MESVNAMAQRFRSDKEFFQEIERSMPEGSKVFCLPYVGFPECPPVYKMPSYEHARGYVMTEKLVWNFGAVKGREADVWHKDVTALLTKNPEHMLERIVAAGFDGLLIDGRGFPSVGNVNQAAVLIKRINDKYQAEAGLPGAQLRQIVHQGDHKQFFLDLRPFRDAWMKRPEFRQQEAYERDWVAALWMADFYVSDPGEDGERVIWGRPDATMQLVNPTDRARKFQISFKVGVDTDGPFEFILSGVLTDAFDVSNPYGRDDPDNKRFGEYKSYVVEVPPGRSKIRIRCKPPNHFATDGRNLCYFIKEFRLREQ
jgi:hypothetical protein